MLRCDYKREKARINAKKWRENNREKHRDYSRRYYYLHKKERLEKGKEYRIKNKDKINKYFTQRFHNNPEYWLAVSIRTRIGKVLRENVQKLRKTSKTYELLGCDIKTLRHHLEKQFKKGMNWENRGLWHIDHIKPIASFNLSDLSQQKKVFHFTNLQPLWAYENLSKGAKTLC